MEHPFGHAQKLVGAALGLDQFRGRREFRRGFHIEPGERVLLVDDILTTGGSLLAMLPAVEAMGGEVSVESLPGRGSTFAFTLSRPE